jgi:GcrA cell cycle regulator
MFLKEAHMGWTDERVEVLKSLWLAGWSASQIAKQLGGVTRNGVIGKVHRLGMSARAAASAPTHSSYSRSNLGSPPRTPRTGSARGGRPRKDTTATSEASKVIMRPGPKCVADKQLEPEYVERFEEPGTATVMTLGAHMCKWPIGDPSTAQFTFCGRKTGQEGPYCDDHERLAHQPMQPRRRRTGSTDLERALHQYI